MNNDRHVADWRPERHLKAQALEDKRRNLREAVTVLYERLLLADCMGEDCEIPAEQVAGLMKGVEPYVPGDELLKIRGDADGPLTDAQLAAYRELAIDGPDQLTLWPMNSGRAQS